jgi:DNA-binding helix-hairpin-helix protein with protein kinase domain
LAYFCVLYEKVLTDMKMSFTNVVTAIQHFNYDELEEVRHITDKLLIEMRRNEILKNAKQAKKDYEIGQLESFDSIQDIRKRLSSL